MTLRSMVRAVPALRALLWRGVATATPHRDGALAPLIVAYVKEHIAQPTPLSSMGRS